MLNALLTSERATILGSALASLARARTSYAEAGEAEIRRRLEALYDVVAVSLERRDLGPIIAYAEGLARMRYEAGVDLADVQTAFNALEEATWTRVLDVLEPQEYAEALGLLSTVLGAGKDALARTYVSLAAGAHAPSLDLRALFAGTDGG